MRIPLFIVRLLINLGILSKVKRVQDMLEGHADYLKYYSNQVLCGPSQELRNLESVLSGMKNSDYAVSEKVDSKRSSLSLIDMSIGSPEFTAVDQEIITSTVNKNPKLISSYPPFSGHDILKTSIKNRLLRFNRIKYSEEEILVTSGATQGIELVFQSFMNAGDGVVLFDPSFMVYGFCANLHRLKVNWLPTSIKNGYISFEKSRLKKVMKKSKMIVINAPSNPTGAMLSLASLNEIVEMANKYDVLILSDEVYDNFYYDEKPISIASIRGARKRTIIVNSLSKSYGMAGFRVGYIAAFKPLIRPISMNLGVRNPFVSNLNQLMAADLIDKSDGIGQEFLDSIKDKKEICMKLLRESGFVFSVPKGTFYVWVELPPWVGTSIDFCRGVFLAKNIRIMPGQYFGPSGARFIRLSLACDADQLRDAIGRIKSYCDELSDQAS